MPAQQSTSNTTLTINPQFKKQLLLLKNLAYEQFSIFISADKMILDEHYRATVLTELEGLDDEMLQSMVVRLKHTPVYIQAAPAQAKVSPVVREQNKKQSLLIMLIASLLVLLVASIISWQQGYLYVRIGEHAQFSAPSASSGQPSSAPSDSVLSASITLPHHDPIIALRLHGSNTIGEELAPALLEAYLESQSVTQMHWLQGKVPLERELQYVLHGQVYAIELYAHGSTTGFKDMLADQADLVMSSRKVNEAEVALLKPSKGDLSDLAQEYIIGLDGVAVIVNKNNPLSAISSEELAQVFAGEITNWQQLGGADRAIHIYARDNNSGTWDTFKHLLLAPYNKQLSVASQRIESSRALSEQIAQDIDGIGFIGLPYVDNSKVLAISAKQSSIPIYPTRFTVSTEDYALSRRLYLYTPNSNNKMAREFSHFVTSTQGQQVVEHVGLVSQNIKLEEIYRIKNAPEIYNHYADIASRLSINLRFKADSNEFDNKAQRDIKRLVAYFEQHPARRIVLMGFSNAGDDAKKQLTQSLARAHALEKSLNSYGVNVTAVEGFGEALPVASNSTPQGRLKNRRVEVWVF